MAFALVAFNLEIRGDILENKIIYTRQVKAKSAFEPSGSSGQSLSGFSSMKRLGVFLLLSGPPLVHRRVTPSINFAGTYLYTCRREALWE